MQLRELLRGVAVSPPPEEMEVSGVSFDTRTLRAGEVFAALPGYETDGAEYIDEAWRKGAAAVVAESGEGVLLTGDVRAALAGMSANWFGHPADGLILAGVTGTNGKTTVTTLLWHILKTALGTRVGLMGTNRIMVGEEEFPAGRTTPESYDLQRWLRQMADAGCTHVVMEVSSHALCLHRVEGLTFAVGAFTNLTRDHLDFHKTMEAYRGAKEKLFSQCAAAVLNGEDETGRAYRRRVPCPAVTFGRGEGDLTARDVVLLPGGVEFTAVGWGEEAGVSLAIPGEFTVSNALCALGCAHVLGVSLPDAAAALATAPGVKGRMEVVPHPGPGTVIIDYAHTPDALENALRAARGFTKGRLLCLFGCGGDRDHGKRPLMGAVAAQGADLCVVTSDNPRSEKPEAIIADILMGMARYGVTKIVEPDRERAIALALSLLREGDTLLLAGKGHESYQEVKGQRRHMDERELVARSPGV